MLTGSATLAATPLLVGALGLARWGIFALALSLVGLFAMFDLGVGRALTRLVAALQVWGSLVAATLVLVGCRAAMTWAYWRLAAAALPELRGARPDWSAAGVLLRQGGWLTVTHLLGPLTQHLDRFIIAARLSAEAAALYATPFDLVIRVAVLGQAVLAGVFPALASALVGAPEAIGRLFRHAVLAILVLVLPPCLACVLFADVLLGWWLGAEFAAAGAMPMRWLAAGVVLFALDGVAAAVIDGAARAARNALLAVAELAAYLPLLLVALDGWGIAGAAVVWTGRALAVGVVRARLAIAIHPPLGAELRALAPALVAAVAGLAVALAVAGADPGWRLAVTPTLLLPAALLGWRHALGAAERQALADRVIAMGRVVVGRRLR